MKYAFDLCLLILYCFFNLFGTSPDFFFVLAFLIALILCCADCFLNLGRIASPLSFLYLAAALFHPAFLSFFPAVSYVLFRHQCRLPFIAALCLYVYVFLAEGTAIFPFCLGLFGILLACILQKGTKSYSELEDLYKLTRDDSKELNILLTEKNHSLLEKQDYEIYTATLRERNRIAREIHDNVGHLLTRSILMLGALKAVNTAPALKEPLDTLDSTLNSAMDNIRNSVHDLHDEAINLKEAVNSLFNDFTFCSVTFEYDMELDVPKEIKYSFISITREALSNVMKHSNATYVHLVMREHPALYQLYIEDNGTQFSSAESGIGLLNMKERIHSLRGNIQIQRDKGFKIFITIPKET